MCVCLALLAVALAHSTHFCYTPLFWDATLLTPLHAMVVSADAARAADGAHAPEPHRRHLHRRLLVGLGGGKGLAERARRLLNGVGLAATTAANAKLSVEPHKKAIVVRGDTKAVLDMLKALGGSWNRALGRWVF